MLNLSVPPRLLVAVAAILVTLFASANHAGEIDWRKVGKLQGQELLRYVDGLGLRGQAALAFWKKVPLSRANQQVNRLFRSEAFAIYMNKYPRSRDAFAFVMGSGTGIDGPISGQSLKLPFTDILPMPAGPIADPSKVYRLGYSIHGLDHPWLLNNADSAAWEADRHPNVELQILDPRFDNQAQVEQIDAWVDEGFDGILVWPMQEAPTGPPIERASAAGISSVSVDRMVGSERIDVRITGNFPANGAQQGLYLIHRLLQELGEVRGKIALIRKPLGSTADAMRTGHFLKVVSYFPGLSLVASRHNSSSRAESQSQVAEILAEHEDLDVIFCTGAEQAMGAVAAVDAAGRWDSRGDGRRIIILSNDDLYEALVATKEGKIAVTAPYTPLLGALGLRALLKILSGQEVAKDIVTPDLPMITAAKEEVFGIETIPVDEWLPYAYGRP